MSCPRPRSDYPRITLAHGGGGRLSAQLTENVFGPAFQSSDQETRHDSALIRPEKKELAMTTDSYVVNPLFFPGGDIGRLAICGTANDLAMAGAKPLWLSAAFILEEGLPMETLFDVVESMRLSALETGVRIVTGDTKVVERGRCDGMYINTAGVGAVVAQNPIHPREIRSGDKIVLSGDIGRHGVAVLAEREGLKFEPALTSDVAPLFPLIQALISAQVQVHCVRDLTRGGLATALVEMANTSRLSFYLEEPEILVAPPVRAACELLGLDPFYVACEGRLVAFVPADHVESALKVLTRDQRAGSARVIGEVVEVKDRRPEVIARNAFGQSRRLELLSGEQLPRIC